MGLAVVTRLPTLVEAQIAAGALRSAGIAAEVFDANFGGLEAPVIESMGGFRVMAPENEAASARQILTSLQTAPRLGEPDEHAPWGEREPAPRRRGRVGWRWTAAVSLVVLALWLARALVR